MESTEKGKGENALVVVWKIGCLKKGKTSKIMHKHIMRSYALEGIESKISREVAKERGWNPTECVGMEAHQGVCGKLKYFCLWKVELQWTLYSFIASGDIVNSFTSCSVSWMETWGSTLDSDETDWVEAFFAMDSFQIIGGDTLGYGFL